jgi:prepilin-type N-terminal cleavage/methylation domain-containing protein
MKSENNKGFTLVELMISMAISAILIGSLAIFMNVSSKSYKAASEEISLQMEAQTILNQLENMIMESCNVKFSANELKIYQNKTDYISITFDSVNQELMFEKVSSGSGTTAERYLFGQYVKNFQVIDTGNNNLNDTIEISIMLENNNNIYSIDNKKVKIRNGIKAVSSY